MRARLGASIFLNNGVESVVVMDENIDKIHEKGVKLVPFISKWIWK